MEVPRNATSVPPIKSDANCCSSRPAIVLPSSRNTSAMPPTTSAMSGSHFIPRSPSPARHPPLFQRAHDSTALVGGHCSPRRNFGKSAAATFAQTRAGLDLANLDAGRLDGLRHLHGLKGHGMAFHRHVASIFRPGYGPAGPLLYPPLCQMRRAGATGLSVPASDLPGSP